MNYVDKAAQNGYTQTVILLKQIFCRCGAAFGRFVRVKARPTDEKAVRQGGANGHGTPHPCRFFRKGQTDMKAVLIPGDGIGREIAQSVRKISDVLATGIEWEEYAAGAEYAAEHGELLSPAHWMPLKNTAGR